MNVAFFFYFFFCILIIFYFRFSLVHSIGHEFRGKENYGFVGERWGFERRGIDTDGSSVNGVAEKIWGIYWM